MLLERNLTGAAGGMIRRCALRVDEGGGFGKEGASGRDGCADQDGIERRACDGQPGGQRDIRVATTVSQLNGRERPGAKLTKLVGQPGLLQDTDRVGIEAAAADLVAWKRLAIDKQGGEPGARESPCGKRTSRPRANHESVPFRGRCLGERDCRRDAL